MRKYLPVVLSVLLVIALAVPAAAGPFADVPQHHWAYEAVKQLAAYGLVIGFPDGEFKGNEPLTRYQMAMVIARLLVSLDAQIKAEIEAAKTVIPEAPAPVEVEKEVIVEQPVIEKVIEKTIVEKLETEALEALEARIAALEGDVEGHDAEVAAKLADLEAKIARGDADNAAAIEALRAELAALEIPVMPEIPDVDAAVSEAIALIDALRAEFITELDVLNARTNVLEGELALAMEKIAALEERADVADLRVDEIDATLAAHLAGHEKVKISGSSEVKFEDVDIRSENEGVSAWKDPSDIFESDPEDNHADGTYSSKTDFKHTLGLKLTAYPADGVTVSAGLKAVTNPFTGDLTDNNLEISSLSLEITTDGILERLYAGGISLPEGTFTPYTFWGETILDDDDNPIYKGVVAELGYDIFSGTLLFTRIREESAAVAEVPWKAGLAFDLNDVTIVWPKGFDPYADNAGKEVTLYRPNSDYDPEDPESEEEIAVPVEFGEDFDPADPSTWDEEFLLYVAYLSAGEPEDPFDLVEITPGSPAVPAKPARYVFAGEGKVALLDNLNLGVAYVRAWDDYLSTIVDEQEVRENFDHVVSVSADYAFAEGWKADGEVAKWWRDDDGVGKQGLATRLNLSGVIGPVDVKGEFVRVPDGYNPEFVKVGSKKLVTDVKTIGVSAEATVLEALKLTGGYKMTGDAMDEGTQWKDWDATKHGITNVGAEYELAWGDLKLIPSANAEYTHFYKDEDWEAGSNRVTVKAGAAAEFEPIEASYYHTYARAKIGEGEPGTFYNRDEVSVEADYDLNENLNLWGDVNWAKQTVADAYKPVNPDEEEDEHSTEFNIGAKANFALYEGIDLKATAQYGMGKDLLVVGTPWTKGIVTAEVGAMVTPKLKVTVDGQYQRLDRFYLKAGAYEQYKYAPVTNMIGGINWNYDITTATVLKLGAKVIKSAVDNRADLSYIARVGT
ncbi:MAG: S-layer homology domain-containing protein, partial [Firmicutes bacterium]|nr:S-layer homology domain-containing protein [Bacillota bacterium]